ELAFGQRVSLEVSFDESQHHVLLQGTVLSAVGGPSAGVWLEFVDTGLSRARLEQGKAPFRQRRLACDAVVQVDEDKSLAIGRMVDVSMGGARIVAIGDVQPKIAVRLRLLAAPELGWPKEIGFAQVVRADLGGVAVRFLRNDPRTRAAATK